MEDIHLLFSAEGIEDPYPRYRRLLEASALHPVPEWNTAFVLGHPEISTLLRDSRSSVERLEVSAADLQKSELLPVNALYHMMLFRDPPNHTRLRSLVSQAFTPRVVQEMQDLISSLVDDLLQGVSDQTEMEVLQQLAVPLPVLVILHMLGLKASDAEHFKGWSESIATLLDGGMQNPEAVPRIMQHVQEMNQYFRSLADDLRRAPQPGLMTALAQAELSGDKLSNEELLSNAMLLLVAGHETTTNLISSGLHALLTHPEQLADLRAHPELLDGAIEELLRFTSPVQGTSRVLRGEVEVGGHLLPAGTHLQLFLAAANRDPRVFTDPHTLNVRRDASRHLSFAAGHHYCLGASLARLEARIVFEKLLSRFSRLELPEQPLQWKPNFTLRGLTSLRVRLEA